MRSTLSKNSWLDDGEDLPPPPPGGGAAPGGVWTPGDTGETPPPGDWGDGLVPPPPGPVMTGESGGVPTEAGPPGPGRTPGSLPPPPPSAASGSFALPGSKGFTPFRAPGKTVAAQMGAGPGSGFSGGIGAQSDDDDLIRAIVRARPR